jgi:AcrR family transcriptional regulator
MPSKAKGKAGVKKSTLRREAILAQALKMFDERGFANTSLDDIAKEIGFKREAIYYYFRNKAEILLCIIRPQSETLLEGLKRIVDSKAKAHDKLYLAIRNHLERFDRNCLEMTVGLRDVYLGDAKQVHREMDKIWRGYETMWTRLIADGQAAGDFSYRGDAKMVAFGILGMCNWLARWYDPNKSVSVDELIETYFDVIGYGLLKARGRRKANAQGSQTQGLPLILEGADRLSHDKTGRIPRR